MPFRDEGQQELEILHIQYRSINHIKNDSEDEQCSCSKINVKIKLYLINKTITLYLKNITLMKSK